MPNDPWRVPIQELMLKDAEKRAAHYRAQAVQLRDMAANEPLNTKLCADLFDMADKYDELANSVR